MTPGTPQQQQQAGASYPTGGVTGHSLGLLWGKGGNGYNGLKVNIGRGYDANTDAASGKIYSSASWGSPQVVPDAGMVTALPLSLVAPRDGAVISMSLEPLTAADSTPVAALCDLATRTTAAPTQTAAAPTAVSQCSGPGVLEVPGASARGAGFGAAASAQGAGFGAATSARGAGSGAAASAPMECGPETFTTEDALWPLYAQQMRLYLQR